MINNDSEIRKRARLKDANDNYKELLEEYIPIVQFTKYLYGDAQVQIRYVGRISQNSKAKHDGEIRFTDGTVIFIEIARPIHGDLIHKQAEQVNLYGYSELDFGDLDEEEKAFNTLVQSSAVKKAEKDYSSSILVFCIPDINFLRNLDDAYYQKRVEDTKHLLADYSYQALEVYLLIPPYYGSHSSAAEIFKIQ